MSNNLTPKENAAPTVTEKQSASALLEKNVNDLTPEELLQLTGSDVPVFAKKLLSQTGLMCAKDMDDDAIKEMQGLSRAMMRSLAPQNGVQAMLSAQMIAVHHLQMHCSALGRHEQHIERVKNYTRFATKLANTFVQQATALNKLQGRGQQKVTVEHVNVHAGGNAIVGNVTASDQGGCDEKRGK